MIFRSKKSKLTLLIIPLLVSLLFFRLLRNQASQKYFNTDFNLGGAITHKNGDFTPIETGSIRLESSEIMNRQHFSGSKTTFLWGLFSFTDY